MSQEYPRYTAFWKHQDRLFLEALDGVRHHPAVRVLFAQLRRVLTDDEDLADEIPEADMPGVQEVMKIMGDHAADPVMVLTFVALVTRQVSPGLDHTLGPLLPRFMAR